ncbi:hypothetical protein [Agromyces italicus]|uniref:hypothetical protein n=1 Tax=Agromyces italicus TaxID=279572 RepID=UPI0003B2E958|nr:hypothetical protein [Agromyces italicus]
MAENASDWLPTHPTEAGVRSAATSLQTMAGMWTGEHLQRPGGSPSSVQQSADAYERIAAALDARARSLDARATEVEQALDADAGRAAAEQVRAFRDLVVLEQRGAAFIAAALDDYASALDDGQGRFDRRSAEVRSARDDAFAVDAPVDFAAEWSDAECRAAISAIRDVYVDAQSALAGSGSALEAVVEAEQRLGYAFSDAAGYARMTGLPATSSTSLVDAALALARGVGDPDRAVLSDAEWAAYVAERDRLSPADRRRLDDALDGSKSPEERQIIMSALASGAGLALTLALARRLRTMSPQQVKAIAGLGMTDVSAADARDWTELTMPDGTVITQKTDTTCGSSSLLMLAAQRDPFLALFLAEGALVDGHIPEYLSDVTLIDRMPEAGLTTTERLKYLQEEIRRQTNQFSFWPGSVVGSAPWGYGDEVARITGDDVDMSYSMLGPNGDAQDLVDRAISAVDSGTPVPFLVGDDSGVPRHYVLLVGHEGDELQFYEPWNGEVRSVAIDDAVDGDESLGAFGGWSSIYGAAVPAD